MKSSLSRLFLLLLALEPSLSSHPPPPLTAHLPLPLPGVGGRNGTRWGGCSGGVQSYPPNWPNSHYYKRYCSTYFGLAVVTDSLASDASLERTAWTLDSMMMRMDSYVADKMVELGFRQAVMGSYPSETVTSLPEYSNLDPNFWNQRRGCGATEGRPVGCNAEEDVLCYSNDLYPDMDITVHEFGHSLHWLGFTQLWPEFQTDLDACYANAYSNSLWGWGYVGSYAMTNSGTDKKKPQQ